MFNQKNNGSLGLEVEVTNVTDFTVGEEVKVYPEKLDGNNEVETKLDAYTKKSDESDLSEIERLTNSYVFNSREPAQGVYTLIAELVAYLKSVLAHLDSLARPLKTVSEDLSEMMDNNDATLIVKQYEKDVKAAGNLFRNNVRTALESNQIDDEADSAEIDTFMKRKRKAEKERKLQIRGMFGFDAGEGVIARPNKWLVLASTITTGIIILGIELYAGQPIFRALGNSIAAYFQSLIWGLSFWILAVLSGKNAAILMGYRDAVKSRNDHFPNGGKDALGEPVIVFRPDTKVWILAIVPFLLLILGVALLFYFRWNAVSDLRSASAMRMGLIGIGIFSFITVLVELAMAYKHSKKSYERLEELDAEIANCENSINVFNGAEAGQDLLETLTGHETTYRNAIKAAEDKVINHQKNGEKARNAFIRLYEEYTRLVRSIENRFETSVDKLVIGIKKNNDDFDQNCLDNAYIQNIFDQEFKPKLLDEALLKRVQEFKPIAAQLPEGIELEQLGKVRAEIESDLATKNPPAKGFHFKLRRHNNGIGENEETLKQLTDGTEEQITGETEETHEQQTAKTKTN